MEKLLAILGRIEYALVTVGGWIVVLFVGVSMYDVMRRKFALDIPKGWSLESGEVVLLLITYLAITYVYRRGGHVKVEILTSRLGDKTRDAFNVWNHLILLIICFLMVWRGVIVSWEFTLVRKVAGQEGFPLWPFVYIVPLAGSLLTLEIFASVWLNVRSRLRAKGTPTGHTLGQKEA